MGQPRPNVDDIGTKHGAWVLPKGCDLSQPVWQEAIAAHRASLRKKLGLIERPERVRRSFVEGFAFLYDRRLYDAAEGRWRMAEFLDEGQREFGGFDQVILWQSYPRMGVDERNQFDYFRDMPGGLAAIKGCVDACRKRGVTTLLAYNPWDCHTRRGDRHPEYMLELLRETGADGIYLDTMHEVPVGWKEAVAKLGRPIMFESEAQPREAKLADMDATWGQGTTVSPPWQILHTRWLQPAHKIFFTSDRHSRDHWDEVRCALFTGTGVLVWDDVFGNDTSWIERDKALLRAVAPILRAFHANFAHPDWRPFVAAGDPTLRVNRFPGPAGTVYTILRTTDEAYEGPLIPAAAEMAYVDLMTGKTLAVESGRVIGRLEVKSIGAVLEVPRIDDTLKQLLAKVCPGKLPAYSKEDTARLRPPASPAATKALGRFGGKKPDNLPEGMVWAPVGEFVMKIGHKWHGASCYDHYGWDKAGRTIEMGGFAIDRYPVTNEQYAAFLAASGYRPKDPHNFLRHWIDGKPPAELARHPVVNVSLADAWAYARWAGKRLPTEAEWQVAAQGLDGRRWPWGDEFDAARCNPGGATTPVGSFAADVSPVGAGDMVGNVWQWTADVYADRVHSFTILKGGSFFRLPKDASEWYIHTGPCPLDSHVKIPLVGPSLDRFSTVGFRCVID